MKGTKPSKTQQATKDNGSRRSLGLGLDGPGLGSLEATAGVDLSGVLSLKRQGLLQRQKVLGLDDGDLSALGMKEEDDLGLGSLVL